MLGSMIEQTLTDLTTRGNLGMRGLRPRRWCRRGRHPCSPGRFDGGLRPDCRRAGWSRNRENPAVAVKPNYRN